MSQTKEICGVCDKDHDNDEQGDMTCLCSYFDYIHWGCYEKAMVIRKKI